MGLIGQVALILALGVTGWTDGVATMYSPGVMEKVAANRGLPAVSCMAAHPQLPIGAWMTVRGRVTLRCQVVDTSHPRDRARHIKTGLVELDYHAARAICPRGWTGNSRECAIRWKRL